MHPESDSSVQRTSLQVAILGGGFAGVYCGKSLGKQLRKRGLDPKKSAIVSNQNYMVFQPMLAEVAGGSLSPRHVINPIRRLCREIQVFKGEIKSIDLKKKEIRVDTGYFSPDLILEYEHLVLTMGAEIDLSRVPGMAEHALLMQNVGDAMILRATIISRIEEANTTLEESNRRRLLTFVVVGGGYSGVETAGEMLDMLHSIQKYYKGIRKDEIRVILIHSRDHILQTLSPSLGNYAANKLRERGLEILLNERVEAITATKTYLQSGDCIETTTVISTVGNSPNHVIQQVCKEQGVENERFRLKTDRNLRIHGQENLWSAGDCALIPLAKSDGEYCPQTAQFAMRQGTLMAENVVRQLDRQDLKSFDFTSLGELASIGHRTAVANLMGVKVSGFLAWFFWRSVYLSKLPGLDRKLRVMIEWTFDLFFPRDINMLNPRYTRVLRLTHLEAGDVLFHQEEPAFSLYAVKRGRIELRNSDGKAKRTIVSGEFFGERALMHTGSYIYDAVATEPTELIALSGNLILPFLQTSRRLRRVIAKTTSQSTAEQELQTIEENLHINILQSPVSEVMSSEVATLSPDDNVHAALRLFRQFRHSYYPVISEEGRTIGALNRDDFFDFMKHKDVNFDTTLNQIDLISLPECRENEKIELALEKMIRSGRNKCLVADEEGKLIGIVSVLDLLDLSMDNEGE